MNVNLDNLAPVTVPMLPLRHGVLFPNTVVSVPMGRRRSLELLKTLTPGDALVIAAQRDGKVNDPGIADLFAMGTLARVRSIHRGSGKEARVTLEGIERVHVDNLLGSDPYWRVEVRKAVEVPATARDAELLTASLAEALREIGPLPEPLEELVRSKSLATEASMFADRVASALGLSAEKEVEVLFALDVAERLRLVANLLKEAQTLAEVRTKIDAEVRKELGKNQREAILREQLRAIRKELGEAEGDDDEVSVLRKRLEEADLPEDVRKVAEHELSRLESAGGAPPERGVIRNYLELIASLPWNVRAKSDLDLDKVAATLDADHYGLADVKNRILEHLAVLKVVGNSKGTILCLVGPPGVGKTSLGQSVASALGRPFVRVALGGVRDEAEIRGHRRTYVGALPGRILNALKTAGAKNPVFLLDEVDKLGMGILGSPEAALLEVLDPEQNKTFQDHYLELPFDLSEVLFICTANTLDTMTPPLRDRLEIIELAGYTQDEKKHIARRHLIPKKLSEHGLSPHSLDITDSALSSIIGGYTREAGVRQLQQKLEKLCRVVTLDVARHPESKDRPLRIDVDDLAHHLGKERFFNEVAERTKLVGVATGLAWTPVGGDILFVETSRMRGKGRLEITGQLGDVMKESARAALTYVRSNAERLGLDPEFLETQDLHIHVPAGGVPKDGPSAGVTIFTAIASLFTGHRVRSDTAMTGECTLRGRVLPVGGIKEKVLAAHRAGLARVILPKKNRRDLDEVPDETKQALEFVFAEDMSEVLDAALESAPEVGSTFAKAPPSSHLQA